MSTLKEEIMAVAAYANTSPKATELLKKYFLDLATQADKDELDLWLQESAANEALFDLLLRLSPGGGGGGILKILIDITDKVPVKKSRWKWWANRIAIGIALLLLLDYLIPSAPVTRLLFGSDGIDFVTTTVEAGDSVRVVWLYPESTRVELQPHAKLGYSKNLYWYQRNVRLWGNARFDVAPSKEGPLRLHAGKMFLVYPEGSFTVAGDSLHPFIQQP